MILGFLTNTILLFKSKFLEYRDSAIEKDLKIDIDVRAFKSMEYLLKPLHSIDKIPNKFLKSSKAMRKNLMDMQIA